MFFTHLSANLDNWDPRVMDGIAEKNWIIAFDNKGVGLSSGTVPDTIQQKAKEFLNRIKERKEARDKSISIKGYLTQLKAIRKWGLEKHAGHVALFQNHNEFGKAAIEFLK